MKKRMSKTTALIALAICVAILALSITLLTMGIMSNRGSNPNDARKAVVFIYNEVYDASGTLLSASSGTGWAIGKPGQKIQYIITAGHVVESAYELPKSDPSAYKGIIRVFFSAAENEAVQAQVVSYSPMKDKDIAILKLPSPTDKRQALVLRPSSSVDSGETAIALGFPGVSNILQSDTRFDISDVTMTRGIISKRVALGDTNYEAFQMDTKINPGNSGGPLVDEHGFLLGVNVAALVTDTGSGGQLEMGVNYASIADSLIGIIRQENVSGLNLAFSVKGEKNWMIFVFSPLAVLSLLALLFFAMSYAKAGKSAHRSAASGAAAAGAAGGVGAAKGKGPSGAGNVPVLRGISGKYAGQRFDFSQGKLTLGRDATQCNIVFDPNTPGISGKHCAIFYDPNAEVFVLTDNGSSFGTFLGNGKKLSIAVSEKLSVGDSFYLADVNNRFVVGKE